MMNYWAKRVLEEEVKASKLAATYANKQKLYYKKAQALIMRELSSLQIEILSAGEEATRTQLWRYGKYTQLQETIDKQLKETGTKQLDLLTEATTKIFEETLDTFVDELAGKTINYQLLGKATVRQNIVGLYRQQDFSQRVWKNTNQLASRIKEKINELIVLGKSPAELRAAITQEFGVANSVADRLIRTEASYAYNSAAKESYKVAGVKEVAVLVGKDERLCHQCSELEGRYPLGAEPFLPSHPRCRCCYAPIVE